MEQAKKLSLAADDTLAELASWRRLDEIVTAELAALLGVELVALSERRVIVAAAELPLACHALGVELAIQIGVDDAARGALQDYLLGGERSAEALADALRELANTVGGALRRAALEEGVGLTIGLPRDAPLGARDRDRAWTVAGGDLRIDCVARSAASSPTRIAGCDLREGMVLARDVYEAGIMVAASGTYLTSTMATRIAELVGDLGVEVTELRARWALEMSGNRSIPEL